MGEQFLGEVRLFPYGRVPQGWLQCNGQVLNIAQYKALASLLGKTYGGDGTTTFGLPNLQGRVPIHVSKTISWGQQGGEASHTLTIKEIPLHDHTVKASTQAASIASPAGNTWSNVNNIYKTVGTTAGVQMNPAALAPSGGSQAHNNMQPYVALNFCISMTGIYPQREY